MIKKLFGHRVYQRVIINTKTDKAFNAVLVRKFGSYVLIRDAMLISDGATTPVDGEVMIPSDNVDFIQVLR